MPAHRELESSHTRELAATFSEPVLRPPVPAAEASVVDPSAQSTVSQDIFGVSPK